MINCKNCGAKLEASKDDIVKCAYCGTVYKGPEKEAIINHSHTSAETPLPTDSNLKTTTPEKTGDSGCGVLLLIGLVIFVIVLAVNQSRKGYSEVAIVDSIIEDTTVVDTSVVVDESQSNIEAKRILTSLANIKVTPERFKKIYKSSRLKRDEFTKSTYLYDRSSPQYVNRNGVSCYVETDLFDNPRLHLSLQYYSDDWLFIQSAKFSVDGETIDYTPDDEFKRDSGDGKIWEWSDNVVSEYEVPLLAKVALSKTAKVKFIGKQYHDIKTVTPKQKLAIKNMLIIYKGLLLDYKP